MVYVIHIHYTQMDAGENFVYIYIHMQIYSRKIFCKIRKVFVLCVHNSTSDLEMHLTLNFNEGHDFIISPS